MSRADWADGKWVGPLSDALRVGEQVTVDDVVGFGVRGPRRVIVTAVEDNERYGGGRRIRVRSQTGAESDWIAITLACPMG